MEIIIVIVIIAIVVIIIICHMSGQVVIADKQTEPLAPSNTICFTVCSQRTSLVSCLGQRDKPIQSLQHASQLLTAQVPSQFIQQRKHGKAVCTASSCNPQILLASFLTARTAADGQSAFAISLKRIRLLEANFAKETRALPQNKKKRTSRYKAGSYRRPHLKNLAAA